jgi:hypothetical protein
LVVEVSKLKVKGASKVKNIKVKMLKFKESFVVETKQ